jgi:hypothetical protein
VVLVRVVYRLALFFFFSYVGGKLLLESKELGEVFDNLNLDRSLVNTDKLRLFAFGNRFDFRL